MASYMFFLPSKRWVYERILFLPGKHFYPVSICVQTILRAILCVLDWTSLNPNQVVCRNQAGIMDIAFSFDKYNAKRYRLVQLKPENLAHLHAAIANFGWTRQASHMSQVSVNYW